MKRYQLARPSWAIPALLFVLLFFAAPLIANVGRGSQGSAYVKLLTDDYYASVLFRTLQISAVTTIACLVVGYPIALFMVRHAGRWSGLVVFLVIAPLLTSIIMRTFGWRVILARKGLWNSALDALGLLGRPVAWDDQEIAVYLGLVHVLVPFMVLSVAAVLQGVDVRLEESARVLGAGRLRTFLHVTLPLSAEGIATGCLLCFVLCNGSFLTMLLLGGGRMTTLALLIYQQFSTTQDVGFAAAMGNVLLLAAVICFALQYLMLRRRNGH